MSVLLEEIAFCGHACHWPADPSIADFLEHVTAAACPRSVIHAGQKARTYSFLQPWTNRREAHMTIRAMSDEKCNDTYTSLRTTLSPDVAQRHVAVRAQPPQPALRCCLRHTQRGRDFFGAETSGRHALHGETLFCGSHHVVRRLENAYDLREMWLVVYGYVIKSVMCVNVQCVKTCCFVLNSTPEGIFPEGFEICCYAP